MNIDDVKGNIALTRTWITGRSESIMEIIDWLINEVDRLTIACENHGICELCEDASVKKADTLHAQNAEMVAALEVISREQCLRGPECPCCEADKNVADAALAKTKG